MPTGNATGPLSSLDFVPTWGERPDLVILDSLQIIPDLVTKSSLNLVTLSNLAWGTSSRIWWFRIRFPESRWSISCSWRRFARALKSKERNPYMQKTFWCYGFLPPVLNDRPTLAQPRYRGRHLVLLLLFLRIQSSSHIVEITDH